MDVDDDRPGEDAAAPAPDWTRYGEPIDLDNPNDSRALVLSALPESAHHVLELGCSAGLTTEIMAERGLDVVGVEIDPVAAELARAHAVEVIVGDLDAQVDGAHLLDRLAERRFDTIVAADVLEHLRDPRRCLGRALDLATHDVTVILSIPNVAHGDVRLALLEGRFDYRDSGLLDRTHVQLFTLASLVSVIRDAGLVPVQWQRTALPLGGTEIPISEELLEFGRRVFGGDQDVLTYQWIVTCRRAEVAADVATWPETGTGTVISRDVLALMTAPIPQPAGSPDAVAEPIPITPFGVRRIVGAVRRRVVRLVR